MTVTRLIKRRYVDNSNLRANNKMLIYCDIPFGSQMVMVNFSQYGGGLTKKAPVRSTLNTYHDAQTQKTLLRGLYTRRLPTNYSAPIW
jgi:hypothetical protein